MKKAIRPAIFKWQQPAPELTLSRRKESKNGATSAPWRPCTTVPFCNPHPSVEGDQPGTTPFTTRLEIDDIEFWAVSIGLKYRF